MDYNLSNIIDIHIHPHPDIHPRLLNDIEACEVAKAAGMKVVLIKSHVVSTADRAAIAEYIIGGIRVFGGLSLNTAISGVNVKAVGHVSTILKTDLGQPGNPALVEGMSNFLVAL